jgi:hypothetical protein
VVLYARDIRQVPWEESSTPLQDVTAGQGGLDVVRAWREEVTCFHQNQAIISGYMVL